MPRLVYTRPSNVVFLWGRLSYLKTMFMSLGRIEIKFIMIFWKLQALGTTFHIKKCKDRITLSRTFKIGTK